MTSIEMQVGKYALNAERIEAKSEPIKTAENWGATKTLL
jgi:hypothetical protein